MTPTVWFGTVAGGLLPTVGVLGLAVIDRHGSTGTPQRLLVLPASPGQDLLHLGLAGWGTTATLRTTHAPPGPSGGLTPPRTTATRTP